MKVSQFINVVAICLMSCAFYGGIVYWAMSDKEPMGWMD